MFLSEARGVPPFDRRKSNDDAMEFIYSWICCNAGIDKRIVSLRDMELCKVIQFAGRPGVRSFSCFH